MAKHETNLSSFTTPALFLLLLRLPSSPGSYLCESAVRSFHAPRCIVEHSTLFAQHESSLYHGATRGWRSYRIARCASALSLEGPPEADKINK